MSDESGNEAAAAVAVTAIRVLAFLAELETWRRLPWYERLVTPRPRMSAA